MESCYINQGHWSRMEQLLQADNTARSDRERVSLLYIIAGEEGLFSKRNAIYDFGEHTIKTEVMDGREDFPSSAKALIKLGFNLYNGYREEGMTPLELFWNLDRKNCRIAQNAIRLRFGY